MPKTPPHRQREIAARYEALCVDQLKGVAAEQTGLEFDVCALTVMAIARRQKVAQPIQSYSPFQQISPENPKVELTRETTTEVFISDIHFHPEGRQGHDPAVWAVMEKMLGHIKPDILFWGGDIVDCYAPSRYDKIPRLATPEAFREEIAYSRNKIQLAREILPDSRFIWLTGNHELRLPRSVATNAPWLIDNFQNIETLLELKSLETEFVEDGFQIGKLRHYHGHNNPGSGRVNIAKTKFDRLLTSFIFGHHHKFSMWVQRDQDGSYYGAFGNGTAQYLSTDYAPNPDWTHGFSVVQYTRCGKFHVDQVLIHKPSVWSHKAEAIYQGIHIKVDMER
jgi:hypothetical protein